MRVGTAFVVILLTILVPENVFPRYLQRQRNGYMKNCVSKFYNRELGPLEILMLPLGEKLWLRAWLGNHMTNLLHMEGVDLAEVTQLATEQSRTKRSYAETENILHNSQLPRNVIPSSYHLMLQTSLVQGIFQGRVKINITSLETTNKIVLHAHKELQISRTAVSVKRTGQLPSTAMKSFSQDNYYDRLSENYLQVKKVIRDMETSHCEILLNEPLLKGVTYQMDIPFSGQLTLDKEQAFYHNKEENTSCSAEMRWFIATVMKQGNARRIFPCFDEPFFKATFEVSITRPMDMRAISTMPIRTSDTIPDDDGWVWDHFQITPPMSPSSLIIFIFNPRNMITISPTVAQGGVKVKGLAQAADLTTAQAMVNYLTAGIGYLERYLGVAFPLPEMTAVFLPDTSASAEDYWGILMVGNDFQASVHLLQQWFGHLVTPEDSTSDVLILALAHYHAFVCPMEVAEECEVNGNAVHASQKMYNGPYDTGKKPQEFQLRKMIWLFRMLNYTLTEKVFRRGIQNFLKNKGFSTFKNDDLWNTLDMQAWTFGSLETEISTKQIANSWISKDHYPVVTVVRNYKDNTALIVQEVFVRRWINKIPGQQTMLWWIPIMLLSQENLDVNNMTFVTWMKEERNISVEIMAEPDSFIIVNPEDVGMFIVNYDSTNWNMLAEYLAGDNQPLIPTATRAKLLHNAWYLAMGGRLEFATALNMTLFMGTETETLVWKALAQVYFTVSWKLQEMNAETKFDRFIGELMLHMYIKDEDENLQEYEEKAEIHALVRYVLCQAGHKEAIQRARVEVAKWLDDQQKISDGSLWGVFRWVDEDWEQSLQRVLQNKTTPGFRGFLLSQLVSSNMQQNKVERILKIVLLNDDYKFSDEEIKEVSTAVVNSKVFLQFLDNHWITLQKRFKTRVNLWQHILEQATKKFKTQEGYNMVLDFYAAHKHEENVANVMEHSLQIIRINKEGIYKNLPQLEKWIEQYLKRSKFNHLFYSTEVASSGIRKYSQGKS